ncbi:hypothetical protein AL036_06610 [Salipiger aestuarii]|uniref:Uncharacterized protein n=1 Tax=Salipiger aestuarii TaxID=568098 RepID=A0A327YB59_9RHOB|nr:hypothetical protein [Salipiger aestuarii]EIE50354.1 hypothetical protein C357_14137 [Citreicella sp. 357]KAA8608552.1 hypothetical protein AL036_06610 [Salipiger aestuarii]KAA8614200.1 hypothetical protein AL037_04435 [Salipiger aestuarii]KAB2542373.1 hypothetical protein AL035_07610 [Salipiger aestuarii]RAK18300.1 hypothetical protein ATI53_101319 [Salipiger aestuarii]
MKLLGLLALLAGPVAAQDFSIDYDRLFEENSDRIMVAEPGVQRLELPGPVIVERRNGRYRADDQSGWGPAGCALDRLFVAGAAVTACPGLYSDDQRDRVAAQLLRGVRFYARNTVPPMAPDAANAAMLSRLAATRDRLSLICAYGSAELAFAAHIAEDATIRRFDRIFRTARLPVTRPCR